MLAMVLRSEILWKTFLTHKVWETPYAIYEEKFQEDQKEALVVR